MEKVKNDLVAAAIFAPLVLGGCASLDNAARWANPAGSFSQEEGEERVAQPAREARAEQPTQEEEKQAQPRSGKRKRNWWEW